MTLSPCPVLHTPRLVLRPHRVDDLAAVEALWNAPEVVAAILKRPSTPAECWTRLLRYAGFWGLLGYGYWALEEKATGRFVGEAGFADFRRGLDPALDGVPEAGWVLAPEVHGRGYATEALAAAFAWADAHPPIAGGRTVCLVGEENGPSLRVAAKMGYREVARGGASGDGVILFERP